MRTHFSLLRRGLAALALLAPLLVLAQGTYPSRPVALIVPFAAGNVTDSLSRMIAERLATALGQPVVVENRPGASGGIGMSAMSRAAPDGYTLGMGTIGTMALNPGMYSKLPYDPYKGVSVVSLVFKGPTLVLVDADSPWQNLSDLIKASQSRTDGLDYVTSGNGSSMHLTGELLTRVTGARLRHVPNSSSGAAASMLLGKHVPVLLDSSTAAVGLVRSGKMRALAVTSGQRLKALPDVPTVAESGYPGVLVDGWLCLVTPPGVPAGIRTRLADELQRIMSMPDVQERVSSMAGVAVAASEAESAEFVRTEQKRWAELIHGIGLKLD